MNSRKLSHLIILMLITLYKRMKARMKNTSNNQFNRMNLLPILLTSIQFKIRIFKQTKLIAMKKIVTRKKNRNPVMMIRNQ